MPIDKAKVQAVHDEVRACFKGQLKSSNKGYFETLDPAPPAWDDMKRPPGSHWKIVPDLAHRKVRNENRVSAVPVVSDRKKFLVRPGGTIMGFGFAILDQRELTGNCPEMTAAAAYIATYRKAGIAWWMAIQPPGDHAFCLINSGAQPTVKSVHALSFSGADAWVIDPWANVCCRVQEFEQQFIAQMHRWTRQGKFIVSYNRALNANILTGPSDPVYLDGFRYSELHVYKASAPIAATLPRAMRERKDAKTKPLPGANGVWSADGDWS